MVQHLYIFSQRGDVEALHNFVATVKGQRSTFDSGNSASAHRVAPDELRADDMVHASCFMRYLCRSRSIQTDLYNYNAATPCPFGTIFHFWHLEIIPLALIEQPRIRQDRPIDQASTDHAHPACSWFDQVGMREQEGFGKSRYD